MKNILGNIFGYCVKIISQFGQLLKQCVVRVRGAFVKDQKTKPQRANSASVSSVRYSRKPNKWWKDKRMIIAGGCVIVAAALVLAFVIPSPSNDALASVSGSLSDNNTEAGGTPVVSDALNGEAASLNETQAPIVSGDMMGPENLDEPIVSDLPELSPIPTTPPDKSELVPGVHDPQMIDIQQRLMDLDYMDEDEPTDYYGNGTKYALQLFQRKNGLQVDGLLGEKTITALYANDALPYTVKVGDRGSDVVAMQERLQELKYLKAGHTGYFGTDTETAVKNFQKRNGLSPDGNVGEYTREVLYSDDARAAKTSSGTGSGSSGSSGSGGGTSIAVGDPDQASVDKLIEIAKSKLGCEYTRAAKGPNEFDCSGFVYYCLNTAGYSMKYMTSSGWGKCGLPKVTSMGDMKRGDIICFRGHVGIYLGDGQMIDAGSSSDNVRICSNIMGSAYWKRNFICARRVF